MARDRNSKVPPTRYRAALRRQSLRPGEHPIPNLRPSIARTSTVLGDAFLIASRSTAGAADAVPTHPVMLATNRIDPARVLTEVDIIVSFLCVFAYEASASLSNGIT